MKPLIAAFALMFAVGTVAPAIAEVTGGTQLAQGAGGSTKGKHKPSKAHKGGKAKPTKAHKGGKKGKKGAA